MTKVFIKYAYQNALTEQLWAELGAASGLPGTCQIIILWTFYPEESSFRLYNFCLIILQMLIDF